MAKTDELKTEAQRLIHGVINCQQAILGYYELGEYRKAYIITLECRSELATLAARLADLDTEVHTDTSPPDVPVSPAPGT